jgi:UDP-glucose 4-epimerase
MARKTRKSTAPAIALTGTSGFVGSSLLRELEKDPAYRHVVAIDHRKPPFETSKTKFYRLDLTETLADSRLLEILEKEDVETVVHAAIPVSPPHDLSWAHELVSVGTMYVLDACAARQVKKLVFASTAEVYGAHATNPNFLAEEHPMRGGFKSRFLKDKIEAELQAQKFARKHPETVVTILRPCTILGPHVRNYKTNFLQAPVIFTVMGFDPLLQFVHEEDVIRAFKLCLDKDFPGVFNIVGDGVLPLSKVLKLAGKIAVPVPAPILYPLVQLLWYGNVVPAPASRLDFLKYLSVADGAKARQVMKFAPRYSTKETLLSFIGAQRLREVNLLEAT